MEKKYKGYFGELQKLVEYHKITQDHPYYNLYEYIIRKNKERIRKNYIKKTLNNNLKRISELLKENFNNNCGIIDLRMQPYIYETYKEVLTNYKQQFENIEKLNNPEEYNRVISDIYIELIESLNENEAKNNQQTIDIYNRMIDDCTETLNGIKYKGKYLIEETNDREILNRTINKEVIKELTNIFSEQDLEAFNTLESFKNKEFKLIKECTKIKENIENSESIVFGYLLVNIQKKIKEYEKIIIEQITKNKKLLKRLQIENIINFINNEYVLNITTDRLGEIKFSGELFQYLNIRCRLKDAEEIIKKRIKNNFPNKDTKEYIEIPDFENMEKNKINEILDMLQKKYIREKNRELLEKENALANIENNKQLFKTKTIKELEQQSDTNILTIIMPVASGMLSRRNALYIVRLLIEIEENQEELNNFLDNENICELPSRERNFIENITMDKLKEYIDEPTNNIKTKRRIK